MTEDEIPKPISIISSTDKNLDGVARYDTRMTISEHEARIKLREKHYRSHSGIAFDIFKNWVIHVNQRSENYYINYGNYDPERSV